MTRKGVAAISSYLVWDSSRLRRSRRLRGQRRARGRDHRGERLGLADRYIGQDLAVEIQSGEFDPVHELRIGQPVLARARIDPLDPQGAEIALAVAPVAIGITQRLLDLLDGDA